MGLLLSFFLFGVWSLSFPIGKYMLNYSPPIFLTGARMFIAGVILMGYLVIRRKIPKLSLKKWLSLFVFGLFSIYLTNILEFWSLSKISAAKTCFIYNLTPFFTAFLSYIHFKEKMTWMKWVGLSIACLGTMGGILYNPSELIGFGWAELSMIGAALFTVYGWVLLRLIVKDEEISPFVATGSGMLMGGAMALITSLFMDSWNPIPIAAGYMPHVFGSIVLLTFVSNILCYNVYGFLLKRYTATLLSLFGLLSPLFVSVHSWFLIKEIPSVPLIVSTFIVFAGLWIVYKEERKQGYILTSRPSKEAS